MAQTQALNEAPDDDVYIGDRVHSAMWRARRVDRRFLTLRHSAHYLQAMTSANGTPSQEEFMSPSEVQALLGVSRRTLWRYRADGVIQPAHHTPKGHARFRRSDVEALRRLTTARGMTA